MSDEVGPPMGNIPRWLQYATYFLQHDMALKVVALILMVLIASAYFGVIENPQMNKLIKAVEAFNADHHDQEEEHGNIAASVEKSVLYLDRNQIDIQKGNQIISRGVEQLGKKLDTLCYVTATTDEGKRICGKD